jgi:hypothetical protein
MQNAAQSRARGIGGTLWTDLLLDGASVGKLDASLNHGR